MGLKVSDFTDEPTPPPPDATAPEDIDETAMIFAAVGEFVSAHIAELGDKFAAAIITAATRSKGVGDEVDAALAYTRALQAIKDATEVARQTKDENNDKEQEEREEEDREARDEKRRDSDS